MTRRTRGAPDAASEPPVAPQTSTDTFGAEHDTLGGVELLEDRTYHFAAGRTGRRIGVSVPGALAGTFLIVALAFGAGLRPSFDGSSAGHEGPDGANGQAADGGDGSSVGDELLGHVDGGGYDKPEVDTGETGSEPDGATKPDGETAGETGGNEEKPDEDPAPAVKPDAPGPMELGLALDGTKVVVSWSMCDFDGFRYYKVVRSTNESVTWPLGEGDTLLGAFDMVSQTSMVDTTAGAGGTYAYRVFSVRSFDGEYLTVCKTDVKTITTPAPEPPPTPKPPKPPTPSPFTLTAWIAEGKPVMEWSSCGDVAFSKFKIVRSLDATVTWPTGESDTLFAAAGPDGHKAWDKDAPGGTTLYYRAFCVLSTESGYMAVASSNVASVQTPVVEPPPAPVTLGFEAVFGTEGVALHWEACTSDGFAFYKVVRSTGPNPSYLPYTDGTQVIGVIENASVTGMNDGDVASGQTWYYRVQSIGYWNGQKIVLGQTAAIAVTIP